MRGIISFAVLVFTLAAILMVAPAVEQVSDEVSSNDAVQDQGHGSIIDKIQSAVLRYAVLMALAVGLIASIVWYLRRERRVTRRPPR